MKRLFIFFIFMSFALTSQAQFEPKTKALGGNLFLRATNPNGFNAGYEFSSSLSPTFSYWQNSRWSHHFSLGYGYSQNIFTNGLPPQSVGFGKVNRQSHNYTTSYGLRRWFNLSENKLFAYSQFQIGGGYTRSIQINSGTTIPGGTFKTNFGNVNIGVNAGLMYRFSDKFALDFQLSLLNYSIDYNPNRSVYYHDLRLNLLNAGFQTGFYYFFGNK
jgi:hypothetical protein